MRTEQEILDKINSGKFADEDIQEMLDVAVKQSQKYKPCDKCGFIAVSKETDICSVCGIE